MTKFNKYSSSNGIITTKWGPSAWNYLFCSIMGAYPFIIDKDNYEHTKIQKDFKSLFSSLQYTLPCPTCQESYRIYWKEIPIDNYMSGRISLMNWLYKIKDRVNKKLICQENELFKIEKNKINQIYKVKDISKEKYDKIIKKLKDKICVTQKSIPFLSVLNHYESKRA
jgi:hypothetical protein